MVKVTKDGISKFVKETDVQKFEDLGFKVAEIKINKPEPMVIEEPKEEKPKSKKSE
jgi:hypothetical protein